MKAVRVPWFGIALALITVALEAATAYDHSLFPELQSHLALDWQALERFEVYRIVVSPFIQTSPGFSPTVLGLTTLVVPVYELREGTRRAVTLFFTGDWLSTLPALFFLQAAGWLGNSAAAQLARTPDSGSSCGGFACMTALLCTLPFRWRTAGFLTLVVFFAWRIALWHRLFDFQHALAAVAGVAVWRLLEARKSGWRQPVIQATPAATVVAG